MVVNGGVTVPINGGVVVPMGPDKSTHESRLKILIRKIFVEVFPFNLKKKFLFSWFIFVS